MVSKSILSLSDRLAVNSVLTRDTSSNFGLLGTLGWIVACFCIFLPPLIIYFQGNYFQSQFIASLIPTGQYYTGSDFNMAISFRNKLDDSYPDHAEILKNIDFTFEQYSYYNTYIANLELCQGSQFQANAINPIKVEQCVKIPANLLYDITILNGYYTSLDIKFLPQCTNPFLCKSGSPQTLQRTQYFENLIANNYYQIIFTSKVLDRFGQQKNQIHKIYSTQYNQDNGFLPIIQFLYWQKRSFVDDSILPWKNNITHQNMVYSGKTFGFSATQEQAVVFGGLIQTYVQNQQYTQYRFYKKLDFIIGMLGGGIFLVFLFFWVPFSYINRTLQKMRNAQQLLLQKEGLIVNQHNLKPITISLLFILKNLIPGKSKEKDIISEAQKEIDIIRLIKKLKVAHRNLQAQTINDAFETKDIQFIEDRPQQFLPDRQALKTFNLTLQSYEAIKQSPQALKIYENNLTVAAIKESQKINQLYQDDVYDKNPTLANKAHSSVMTTIKNTSLSIIRFFDIFGAKPMFDAQPYNSSCWGFFLTCLIIVLSILTFALTIKNMNTVQMLINYSYQRPQDCNYQLTTGKNYRIAVCFNPYAIPYLQGSGKVASLTFYTNSTKYGYQQIDYIQMGTGQYQSYFQTDPNDPYNTAVDSTACFRITDDIKIPFGGSPQSVNSAFFGFKLSPYCFGTPSTCAATLTTTLQKYVNFVNYYGFYVFMSQNQYSPSQNRLVSGANLLNTVGSGYVQNATIYRQYNYYLDSIELVDDSSHWFVRQPPITLQKTTFFNSLGDQSFEKYGDPNMSPDFVLKLRASGNTKQVILRNYKIDELFGIMGGVFVFWYFFVHFFAKRFNHFKLRAKLAEILYRQDALEQSPFIQFIHLFKIPIVCCQGTQIGQDVRRVKLTQQKIINDLDYLQLVKYVDNCYRLSSSFFNSVEAKDLSLIYFKQKIDESQKVYVQVKTKADQIIFQDDQFLEMDDDDEDDIRSRNGVINQQMIPQQSGHNIQDLDKYLNRPASQKVELYDHDVPYQQKNNCLEFLKTFDIFKNQAQLTLDGQRDVKSIFGGIIFFILVIFVILVAQYFVGIYLRGDDYTVSYERYIDSTATTFSSQNQFGQITNDLILQTGKNFKFAISFYQNTHFYPYNVSSFFGANGPLALKAVNVTTTRQNGVITTTQTTINLIPCKLSYLNGWIGQYTNPSFYDQNFQNAFCLPDGYTYVITGPQDDKVHHYFKILLQEIYNNSTGLESLRNFTGTYYTNYYMSAPIKNIFSQQFKYQMSSFSLADYKEKYPIQRNLTFTKLIFTDKYKKTSRESYNDDSDRNRDQIDQSSISNQYTHNLTFYYTNIIDRYTLDYQGGAQLFGVVGGIIVFFIFGFGCIVSSFNNYRMKYLIGKKLYRFDKTSTGVYKDSKKKKTNLKKIEYAVKQINNFSQLQLLWAWMLNPIAYFRSNYNFDKTLRRVTLIEQRVDKDLNLFNFYTMLNGIRDAINKKIKLSRNPDIKVCSIYPKHVYHQQKLEAAIPLLNKQTKKNNLSPFEQIKIGKAIDKKLNPSIILGGNKTLNRAFGLEQGTSITGTTNMNESMGQTFMTRTRENANNVNTLHQKLNSSNTKLKEEDFEQKSQQQIKTKQLQHHFQIEQQD